MPGATEVHLIAVARVIVTESRRNWLHFAGYQLRKNWSSRPAGVCFFFFAGHFLWYVTMSCVLQIYKQLSRPPHVFSNERASKRAVSNVWRKGVLCMMTEFIVGLQKVLFSLFLCRSFFSGVFLFSSIPNEPSTYV